MRPWRVVGDAKQKIEAILELAVSKVVNSVQRSPPESESGAAVGDIGVASSVRLPCIQRDVSNDVEPSSRVTST